MVRICLFIAEWRPVVLMYHSVSPHWSVEIRVISDINYFCSKTTRKLKQGE